MAASDRYTGENLVVVFNPDDFVAFDGGATTTFTSPTGVGNVISGEFTSFEVDWTIGLEDVTSSRDGGLEHQATLESMSFSLTTFMLDGASDNFESFPGVQGTLWWYPKGTVSGSPVGKAKVLLGSKANSISFNDGIIRTLEWIGLGTLIKDIDNSIHTLWLLDTIGNSELDTTAILGDL